MRFLSAINYYGLVEMEYKLDLREGKTNYWMSMDSPGETTALAKVRE